MWSGGGGYVSYSVSARTRTHPLGRSSLPLHSGCLNLYQFFIFLLFFLSAWHSGSGMGGEA